MLLICATYKKYTEYNSFIVGPKISNLVSKLCESYWSYPKNFCKRYSSNIINMC